MIKKAIILNAIFVFFMISCESNKVNDNSNNELQIVEVQHEEKSDLIQQ